MLEKVLKRLCPCYYGHSDECGASKHSKGSRKSSGFRHRSRSRERSTCSRTTLNSKYDSSSCCTTDDWKGTLNIVQPQPIYAFPIDTKKSVKRNQKALLKPPLYWKKTMKDLCPEGPPVFQQHKKKHKCPLDEKKETSKAYFIKRPKASLDVTSVSSASNVDVTWGKAQNLTTVAFNKKIPGMKKNDFSISNPTDFSMPLDTPKNENCAKCLVQSDACHGVILFTAAYFSRKKLCMINIEKLENLSTKGRDSRAYFTVVKLSVLPAKKYVKRTKILTSCSNPEIKQDFTISVKDLTGKVLRFSVFDAALQKPHEAVGHALLPLDDIICEQPKKYRIKLYRRTRPHICPGNLALCLRYSCDEDRFTITVEKGKNLSLQKEKNVKFNTYVKVTMYAYGQKVKAKKSVVVPECRDPNYNSTFTFRVRNDQIDHLSVAITVRLKGLLKDVTIGRLNFGPFFYVENQKLTPWGRVFLKKEVVCHWYRMYL